MVESGFPPHLHCMQCHSRRVQEWSGRARHPGPFGARAASTSNQADSYEQGKDHLQLTLHYLNPRLPQTVYFIAVLTKTVIREGGLCAPPIDISSCFHLFPIQLNMHSQSLGRNLVSGFLECPDQRQKTNGDKQPFHGNERGFHGLSTVPMVCECMKHLRIWPEGVCSKGTTGAGGQKAVVRGRPGLRPSGHDLFRTSSFFLAHEEFFAYEAVSWKFLSGTFRTNLSQVRLETCRCVVAGHWFTEAPTKRGQGTMKSKTRYSLAHGIRLPFFNALSFAMGKRRLGPRRANGLKVPWFQKRLRTICWILHPPIGTYKAQEMKLDKHSCEQRNIPIVSAKGRGWNGNRFLLSPIVPEGLVLVYSHCS